MQRRVLAPFDTPLTSVVPFEFRSGPFLETANQPARVYEAVILIWRFANNRCLC
jgi:hypothetical protein